MDPLRQAVVDLTTLVATGQALRHAQAAATPDRPHAARGQKLPGKQLRQATLAYIDKLARARQGRADEQLLATCRCAAERQMPDALRQQEALAALLASQPHGLQGTAAARQDLWLLARITNHLRRGSMALREAQDWDRADPPARWAARLRRRLRQAMTAYALELLRDAGTGPLRVPGARRAACCVLQSKALNEARRLVRLEQAHAMHTPYLLQGVWRPLRDLMLDWCGDSARGTPVATRR